VDQAESVSAPSQASNIMLFFNSLYVQRHPGYVAKLVILAKAPAKFGALGLLRLDFKVLVIQRGGKRFEVPP